MPEVTLESVQAQHDALGKLIEQLQQRARVTPQPIILALPEAHIPLQPGEHYAGAVLDEDGRIKHHLVLLAPRVSSVNLTSSSITSTTRS